MRATARGQNGDEPLVGIVCRGLYSFSELLVVASSHSVAGTRDQITTANDFGDSVIRHICLCRCYTSKRYNHDQAKQKAFHHSVSLPPAEVLRHCGTRSVIKNYDPLTRRKMQSSELLPRVLAHARGGIVVTDVPHVSVWVPSIERLKVI